METEKGRILLIWDRIGDYHAARFLELETQFGINQVLIADLGGTDGLYGWENPLKKRSIYYSLSQKPVGAADFRTRFASFRKLVKKENVSIIGLAGYGRLEYNAFIVWAWLNKKKVILFAESWYGKNPAFNFVKGLYLRAFCSGFLVSGIRAKFHFQNALSVPENRIQVPYSVVDNLHFATGKGPKQDKVMLCVARFSPEKNLEQLVEAFAASELSKTWTLRLVGGGPLKETLMNLSKGRPNIEFLDWLPYVELPNLYASAGVFVLPSLFEPWGLVINEAMAAGLPILASLSCGAQPDLVSEENGWTFDGQSMDQLVVILNEINRIEPFQLKAMGEKSRIKIMNYSCKTWAEGFLSLATLK